MNQPPPQNTLPPQFGLTTTRRPVTYPDVWMRFIQELPALAIITFVGVIALKGQLSTLEAIFGFAVAMLGRSRPADDVRGISTGMGLGALILRLVGFGK